MRDRRLSARRSLALLFLGLLGSVLALFLLLPSARVTVREPLVPRPLRGPLVAVPLDARVSPRGTTVHQLGLSTSDLPRLLAHDELWLYLGPPRGGAGGRLVGATLRVRGGPCHFEAIEDAEMPGLRTPLVLRLAPSCARQEERLRERLDLTVEVEGRAPLALWAHRPRDAGTEFGGLEVGAPGAEAGPPLRVRGFVVDHPPTAPRVALLNDMWRISPGTRWLWLLFGGGVGLGLAGCLVFPTRRAPNPGEPSFLSFVASSGAGAALLAGSLTVLYSTLTPPLMGPDEPYHLLGLADLVGDESWPDEIVAWMGDTHLLRIRYHSRERFRTVDRGRPGDTDDPQLRATEVEMRSATVAALWRGAGSVLRGLPVSRVLLSLRLLNSLLFALALGVMTALAAACAAAAYPQWLCFPFLFVPALPFFAMHVSETAILCAVYVLLAMSLAILFLDGPRAHWVGLPLGLATGSMLAAGRSPWPMAAVVATALLARVLLGPGRPGGRLRSAFVFWAGFGLGGGLFYLLLNEAFRRMVMVYTSFVTASLRAAVESLLDQPALAGGLVVVAASVEVALGPLRNAVGTRVARFAEELVRWVAIGLAVLVVASLIGSVLVAYPHLELEPPRPLTVGERVVSVLTTTATMFRLRDPDFLLFTSFWAGFGWLDTIPPRRFLSLLSLLTGAVSVGLFLHLARGRQVRRFLWLLALGLGAAGSLVVFTLATQDLPMALQGRYLIGWYLVVLTVLGSWLALADRPPSGLVETSGRLPTLLPRGALLLVLAATVHVYCLCFILGRYF